MDIANRCKKQITIIDACRGYQDFVSLEGISGEELVTFDSINPEGSRGYEDAWSRFSAGRQLAVLLHTGSTVFT